MSAAKGLRARFAALLAQGLTPEALARTVTVGAALGLFPIFGTTTVLCALAAQALRLNHGVIQLVNYALYPVYPLTTLALLAVGARMTGGNVPGLDELGALAAQGPLAVLRALGATLGAACALWLLASALAAGPVFLSTRAAFRRLARKRAAAVSGPPNPE